MNDMEIKDKEPVAVKSIKNSTKVALWLFVIGIILFVIGAIWFNMKIDKIRSMKDKIIKSKSISEMFEADSVSNIAVDLSATDLKIEKSADKKIHVVGEKVPESLEAKVDGNKLLITSKKEKNWFGFSDFVFSLILWDETNELTVQLPEKEYDICEIKHGAGDTNIADLKCRVLSLDFGAGDIDVSGIECKEFETDMSAGDMDISRIKCTSAEIDMSAGNFSVKDMTCETADFDVSAGDMEIDGIDCSGKLIFDKSAGDTKIINAVAGGFEGDNSAGDMFYSGTVNGDIRVDSSAGDITFKLTNPESDFNKNIGKYKIEVDCSAGDKSIEYNS